MPLVDPIRVDGLRELQAALKAADGESQKQLRVVFNEAAEVIAAGTRRIVPSRRAAASVKPRSQQREARVVAGGSKAPFYAFLEWGNKVRGGRGRVGRGDSVPRSYPGKDGRYLFVTYNRRKLWVYKELERGLQRVITNSGLDG